MDSEEFIALLRSLEAHLPTAPSTDGVEALLRERPQSGQSAAESQPTHAGSKRWRLVGHGIDPCGIHTGRNVCNVV